MLDKKQYSLLETDLLSQIYMRHKVAISVHEIATSSNSLYDFYYDALSRTKQCELDV